MNRIIDYFDIDYTDKVYIKNFLKKGFDCDIEFGKYIYNKYTCKKEYTDKYYFIIKKNNYPDSEFKQFRDYLHYTTSQIFSLYIKDQEYENKFIHRNRHIFKSYKDEMIEYTEINMLFFVLLYNAKIEFSPNKIFINISTKNNYSFSCEYNLYGFRKLKDFINDITIKEKIGNL